MGGQISAFGHDSDKESSYTLVADFFVTVLVALDFAQRAFIAADIAALPLLLILLFLASSPLTQSIWDGLDLSLLLRSIAMLVPVATWISPCRYQQ
jgi:hypothetical protein